MPSDVARRWRVDDVMVWTDESNENVEWEKDIDRLRYERESERCVCVIRVKTYFSWKLESREKTRETK